MHKNLHVYFFALCVVSCAYLIASVSLPLSVTSDIKLLSQVHTFTRNIKFSDFSTLREGALVVKDKLLCVGSFLVDVDVDTSTRRASSSHHHNFALETFIHLAFDIPFMILITVTESRHKNMKSEWSIMHHHPLSSLILMYFLMHMRMDIWWINEAKQKSWVVTSKKA